MGAVFSSAAKNNPPPPKKAETKSVPIQINLKTRIGLVISLSVKTTDTIESVKEELFKKTGVPTKEQRFIFYAMELKDNDTFEICEKQKDCIISLDLMNRSSDAIKHAVNLIKSHNSAPNISAPEAPVMADEKKQVTNTAGSAISESKIELNKALEQDAIAKRHQEVMALTSQGFLSAPSASSSSSAVTPPADSTYPAGAGPTPLAV